MRGWILSLIILNIFYITLVVPTPKTYFRVTSLKVDKIDNTQNPPTVGPTWDADHE